MRGLVLDPGYVSEDLLFQLKKLVQDNLGSLELASHLPCENELASMAKGFNFLITSYRTSISKSVLQTLAPSGLKAIFHLNVKYRRGTGPVDVAAAEKLGIPVFGPNRGGEQATAEWVLNQVISNNA